MTKETKTRTITLTGRAPVRINEAEWPEIASGRWKDHDNQYECQANRTWDLTIRVRQHADGRAIVYATYDYDTQFQNEAGFAVRVGGLVAASGDLVAEINNVAAFLRNRLDDAEDNAAEGLRHIAAVKSECIGELSAEVL